MFRVFYSSEFTITRENLFATNNVGNSNTIRRICIDIHKQTGKHFMCAHVYVKQEFKGSYVHCVWPSIVHHYGVWLSIFLTFIQFSMWRELWERSIAVSSFKLELFKLFMILQAIHIKITVLDGTITFWRSGLINCGITKRGTTEKNKIWH